MATTISTTDGDLIVEDPVDGVTVMRMPRMVDVYTAPAIREASVNIVNSGGYRIVADLTGVDLIDSTGLGVLVGMLKRSQSHAGTVAVVINSEKIAKAFRVTTMDKVFEIYPTVDEAMAALGGGNQPRVAEGADQSKPAEELNAANVEVDGRDGVHYYAGIRRIQFSGLDIWPDEANLEPGVLRVGPGTEIKFLTDQQINEIAYAANEYAADTKGA